MGKAIIPNEIRKDMTALDLTISFLVCYIHLILFSRSSGGDPALEKIVKFKERVDTTHLAGLNVKVDIREGEKKEGVKRYQWAYVSIEPVAWPDGSIITCTVYPIGFSGWHPEDIHVYIPGLFDGLRLDWLHHFPFLKVREQASKEDREIFEKLLANME